MTNTALNDKVYYNASQEPINTQEGEMTIEGTTNKTILLGLVLIASAVASWVYIPTEILVSLLYPSIFVGLILAIFISVKPRMAPIGAVVYAAIEGVVLATISMFFELQFPGIIIQAVGLTFTVFIAMLALYKSGAIEVTPGFRTMVFVATGGIALFYLVAIILGLFGTQVPLIHSSGPFGIGFSVFVVGLAAFNLVIDFDFIKQAAKQKMPKYMEWYSAFGIIITLVWLYIEILRLLSKLRD